MEKEKIEKLEEIAEWACLSDLEQAKKLVKAGRLKSAVNLLQELIAQLD